MLTTVIDTVISALREAGVPGVYSAFDAVPVERKGSGFFTVVGISSLEAMKPIYSLSTVFIPFRAALEISVTAPEGCKAEGLCSFYDRSISPVIAGLSGLTCRMSKLFIKHDTNINRLVLSVQLTAEGMEKTERSTL